MSLVEIKDLQVHYPIRSGFFNRIHDYVYAVDGVSFEIEPGQTYGLIGETGSGKTTIGRSIIGLEKITSGKILFDGHDVSTKKERKAIDYNRDVQMIFQDSLSSLNPKKRIYDIIAEPLRNFEKLSDTEEKHRVRELLDTVGLGEDDLFKYPFEFSGGQRQRIGVARAISTNPKLVIADEPVSALDLSVQAQVLNYMQEIQSQFNISYLFISHDLGVVRHMCDSMAIMHRGRFVELGTRDDIYNHPQHIYTKRLLAAIPDVNVDQRDAQRKHRKEVEKIFDTEQSRYYDKNGRVLPLQKVSETHSVALPEDQVKGE
ncbi:Oligopeptide transport ATP-binding protein OppF [Pediococcus damnosus]|uniref:Oligopeptide transport ATP-binding protein OppF n=1 Tax=Pediococcus damnosus TaxID=51663 RepID=A0A0R2H714_9LACO|nr:ATP-binding cassette domain-containing protein [Pediococcus damnosus]AMV63514.1 Oligopeptide transport ATP-binding protein OppF [Pediococcus damnosus]AMV66548.1 Oligopeptide transport ATP-binding protein OppF [Pediococcus damnosus]AMV68844.1 Oligopeptide transport ATP-binding protein OppF [Pediococcus damnosus]KJU74369.1 peptide ABC transporter substrate-binding protein [Pediococcus damnosus LMG 28219]KRN47398.1 ABC superfamily ATP binding cassette transporter, ABC protein [Pediococcus damn